MIEQTKPACQNCRKLDRIALNFARRHLDANKQIDKLNHQLRIAHDVVFAAMKLRHQDPELFAALKKFEEG